MDNFSVKLGQRWSFAERRSICEIAAIESYHNNIKIISGELWGKTAGSFEQSCDLCDLYHCKIKQFKNTYIKGGWTYLRNQDVPQEWNS